ncbi:signal peptidase I [Herbiconiux sp. VKM Ac-1786]|uniref:signal peptidase I n=1 Tax=Herbiconiux sp. VKM Ac-1786 TaxID=2783824 RepID=UPI001E42AD0A|nr:signal peptidase I [Herbiconiux sp. VKM Ac-1786]
MTGRRVLEAPARASGPLVDAPVGPPDEDGRDQELPAPLRHRAGRRHRSDEAGREHGVLHAIGVGLSAGLLVLVLGLAVVTILLPLAVGGRPLTVLTQSMEPGLPPGTLIIVKPEPVGEIRLGDVVTYQIESGKPGVVSHRVVEKTFATDGSLTFRTKGDNNDAVDEQPVREVQIVGVLWYSVPLLGWVNTGVNGEARALIVPIAAAGLFGYAAWAFGSSLLARRRGRRGRRRA